MYEIINKIANGMKSPLYETRDELKNEMASLLASMDAPKDHDDFKMENVEFIDEKIHPEFNIPLIITNELHHFGHLTEKSKSLSAFCSEAFLEISPGLGESLDIEDGTIVRIESEVGKINLPVRISEHIENDVVLIYRNFSASPVNVLQMRKRKVDRVKISVVEGT